MYLREGQSRRPAAGVRVVARSADGKEVLRALDTDTEGRYTMTDLPGASIRLSAAKRGYIARTSGGGDANLLLNIAGAAPVRQDFDLLTGGVITGRITDPQAEPLKGVQIELRRTEGAGSPPLNAVTDDNGVYRAFDLEPGRYIVSARLGGPAAPALYFPGRSDAGQAQPIEVAAGSETEGIDLRLFPEPASTIPELIETKLEELPRGQDGPHSAAPPPASVAEDKLGSISGQVLSAQTGELLKSASVRISALVDGKLSTQTTSTGPAGVFLFDRLKPGAYGLFAEKAGYESKTITRQVAVAEKQNRTGVEIKLNRAPAISGRIRDWEGRPVIGASVSAYRMRWLNGRRIAARAGSSATDDRGVYRLTGLSPGRYLIGASKPAPPGGVPKGELDLGSGRTFYPSATSSSQALMLDARYGQELTEVNLDIVPQETFSVSGVVADLESQGPCTACLIRAVSLDESYGFTQAQSGVALNGVYSARGLPPGSYRLIVEKNSGGRRTVSSQTIEIANRDLTGVNVLAGVSRGVSGRVVFESEPPSDPAADPKADPKSEMEIVFSTPEGIGTVDNAHLEKDSSFRISGLSSEDYVVRVEGLPEGGYLKAMRVAYRDLPAPDIDLRQNAPPGPLELVVSFKSAKIAGQVKIPDAGQNEPPPVNATVVLFPRENESPYLTSLRAGTHPDGGFTLTGIPPGSYTAFAVLRDSKLDMEDPVVRKQIENYGKAVALDSGKVEVLELSLVPED